MQKNIVFVHGMFQNPKSWKHWIDFFTHRGYNCIAPAWPDHDGEPAELRLHPPATLGELKLEDILNRIEDIIATLPEKPIVIGHSVGGLITQLLANKDLIRLGVPVSSVAPNAMLAFDWNFFKNSMTIANPFKGNQPMLTDAEAFYASFCNTLSVPAAREAFEQTATHDSRNVLRDCMLAPGHLDLDRPHVPLLFVTGDQDRIIPYELVDKNAHAYTDQLSRTEYRLFMGRSHYICGEPGWEEVAEYVYEWLERHIALG
ncbi:MAG: alpha/beta fold hydrolase [Bacteroidota bacterium]